MADDLNQLIKPAGAGMSGDEPVIHVIPEKFYGAALKKNVPISKPVAPAPAAPAGEAPKPPAEPPTDTQLTPPLPKKKKRSLLPIIAIIILVLVLAGLGVYFFLFSKPAPVENVNNAPVVNIPAGPVCGDTRCESPETNATCSADCKPPAPVCGDAKCDTGETTASCAADCPAPAPVCGDNKCESPETITSCQEDCRPPAPTPGADADSDGITDLEEQTIYATSSSDPNTDKDSFVDLNEVLNLFDPAKPSPANLRDAPGIAVYGDTQMRLEVFRPAAWLVGGAGTGTGSSVTFSSADEDAVSLNVQAKTGPLMEWYLSQNAGVSAGDLVTYKTRQGYDAIISADQLSHFVDLGDRVVAVSYKVGRSNLLQYKVTFQMMVQSLRSL